MTASTVSPAWIAEQEILTLFDLAGTKPYELADQLGIRIGIDDYNPIIDSLCQAIGITPEAAEPHREYWLEWLFYYFW